MVNLGTLTLSSYAPISGNAHFLSHPIDWLGEVLVGLAPFMLLLQVVHRLVAFGEDERAHQDPLRDCGAVDPGGGGDGDVRLGEQGMRNQMIHAGAEEVQEVETGVKMD